MFLRLLRSVNVDSFWYSKKLKLGNYLLLPFAWVFAVIICLRRTCYQINLFKVFACPLPIIVVGNVTVGGTGKTPFVIWLAAQLKAAGESPAIITRGVGGCLLLKHHVVNPEDAPSLVGDEALLLAKETGCPVVVGKDRVASVNYLLAHTDCSLIISDDGLQHYQLGRDVEIAMIDGARKLGNGYLLPAGPLREPERRLQEVDFVVLNGESDTGFNMSLQPIEWVSVKAPSERRAFDFFSAQKVHGIAGIGNPERFFRELRRANIDLISHPFPDHHLYSQKDFAFDDCFPILMTAKDAVKCGSFADERYWYLKIKPQVDARVLELILMKLKLRRNPCESSV